jgi:hypothetical protein
MEQIKESKSLGAPVSGQHLTLFAEVIAAMDRRGVPYWIDQGSLLGAIREGAFFAWDHDVDLGTSAGLEGLGDTIMELAARGAQIEVHPYVIKLRRDRGEKVIDLRLYRLVGDRALAELASTPDEPRTFLFGLGLRWSKKLQRKAAKLLCLFSPDPRHGATGVWTSLRRNFALWLVRHALEPAGRFRDRFRRRRVFFEVEAAYFQTLQPLLIYGLSVKVPQHPEAYLAMKYGADWQRPNPDWVYWRDDGALVGKRDVV